MIVLLRSFVLTHPLPHTRARTLPGQVLGRLAPAVGAEAAGCAAVTAVFSKGRWVCALVRGLHLFGDRMLLDH